LEIRYLSKCFSTAFLHLGIHYVLFFLYNLKLWPKSTYFWLVGFKGHVTEICGISLPGAVSIFGRLFTKVIRVLLTLYVGVSIASMFTYLFTHIARQRQKNYRNKIRWLHYIFWNVKKDFLNWLIKIFSFLRFIVGGSETWSLVDNMKKSLDCKKNVYKNILGILNFRGKIL